MTQLNFFIFQNSQDGHYYNIYIYIITIFRSQGAGGNMNKWMNAKIINISYNFWKNLFEMLKLNGTRLIGLLIKKNNLKNILKTVIETVP